MPVFRLARDFLVLILLCSAACTSHGNDPCTQLIFNYTPTYAGQRSMALAHDGALVIASVPGRLINAGTLSPDGKHAYLSTVGERQFNHQAYSCGELDLESGAFNDQPCGPAVYRADGTLNVYTSGDRNTRIGIIDGEIVRIDLQGITEGATTTEWPFAPGSEPFLLSDFRGRSFFVSLKNRLQRYTKSDTGTWTTEVVSEQSSAATLRAMSAARVVASDGAHATIFSRDDLGAWTNMVLTLSGDVNDVSANALVTNEWVDDSETSTPVATPYENQFSSDVKTERHAVAHLYDCSTLPCSENARADLGAWTESSETCCDSDFGHPCE